MVVYDSPWQPDHNGKPFSACSMGGGYIALQRQSQARENVIEKVEYKPSL